MTAGWQTTTNRVDRDVACLQNIEILQANKGRDCRITLNDRTKLQGIIREVLVHETKSPISASLGTTLNLTQSFLTGSTGRPQVSGIAGTRFVLRMEEGDVMLPVSHIHTLTIRNMATTLTRTVTRETRRKRLTLRFAEPNHEHKVTLMYFRPGLRWIPTYRISLDRGKEKMAEIAMQAEILNEAEDLINVPLDIVVGVPAGSSA